MYCSEMLVMLICSLKQFHIHDINDDACDNVKAETDFDF